MESNRPEAERSHQSLKAAEPLANELLLRPPEDWLDDTGLQNPAFFQSVILATQGGNAWPDLACDGHEDEIGSLDGCTNRSSAGLRLISD